MGREDGSRTELARSLLTLAMVNTGVWAISIIALVFLIQRSPSAKGMFPILGGGTAVAVALLSAISKNK